MGVQMMWPNFFLQEEEQRVAGLRGRAGGKRRKPLTDAQEGKIKLAFFVAIVGVTLTVLAVGTEFWVELNTYKQNHSTICEAAHYGLWKFCYKRLWVEDIEEERKTCGPAELPGGECGWHCGPCPPSPIRLARSPGQASLPHPTPLHAIPPLHLLAPAPLPVQDPPGSPQPVSPTSLLGPV